MNDRIETAYVAVYCLNTRFGWPKHQFTQSLLNKIIKVTKFITLNDFTTCSLVCDSMCKDDEK